VWLGSRRAGLRQVWVFRRVGDGRAVAQMRVSVTCQSCWGSVTMIFGKGYRPYNYVTMGSHAWYSLTTASWP